MLKPQCSRFHISGSRFLRFQLLKRQESSREIVAVQSWDGDALTVTYDFQTAGELHIRIRIQMRPSIYFIGYATLIFPLLKSSRNSFRMNTNKKEKGCTAGSGADSEGKGDPPTRPRASSPRSIHCQPRTAFATKQELSFLTKHLEASQTATSHISPRNRY
jgi:hypothetical protein